MSLKTLNKTQRAAVEATDGPVLIFAGAGSGKTRVLTHKMFHLIQKNKFKHETILSVHFKTHTTTDIYERVTSLYTE